jgi:ankyrin repeat protein
MKDTRLSRHSRSHRRVTHSHVAFFALPLVVLSALTWWQMQGSLQRNALFAAVRHNDTAEVIALLNAGADPNARDPASDPYRSRGEQFFDALSHQTHENFAQTPLYAALYHIDHSNPQQFDIRYIHPDPALITALLKSGADPYAKNADNGQALMFVVQSNDIKVAEAMLVYGVDVNHQDGQGATPYFFAVRMGNAAMVRLFLAHGAKIDMQDAAGSTPLINAAQMGRTECVRELLAHRARVNIRDKKGKSALFYALMPGRWLPASRRQNLPAIIHLLKQAGAK